jgi:hypothetical protein
MLSFLYDANFRRKQCDPQMIRKMRLFACGCCRELWDSLPAAGREAIKQGEAAVDGTAHKVRIDRARRAAEDALPNNVQKEVVLGQGLLAALLLVDEDTSDSYANAEVIVKRIIGALAWQDAHRQQGGEQHRAGRSPAQRLADVAREVFGNPFRPPVSGMRWITPAIQSKAEAIYTNQSLEQLSAFADEIQSAGCNDETLLAHLRSTAPHLRGCWAIDEMLGRHLDSSIYRKLAKKATTRPAAPPSLEEGAVWVTIEEPYGLICIYDEGNRTAIEQSPLAEHGIELFHEKTAKEVQRSGLFRIVPFDTREREDPFVGQVYVGEPPAKNRLTAKSASSGQIGLLRLPTGRLRLEGATSMTVGPEKGDNPSVEVQVTPGVYQLGLFVRKADKVPLLVLTPTNDA